MEKIRFDLYFCRMMQQLCCVLSCVLPQTAYVLPGEDALTHGMLLLPIASQKPPLAVVVPGKMGCSVLAKRAVESLCSANRGANG